MIPLHKYLETQPDDIEPVELTYFDEWTPVMTDENVISAWSATLGVYMKGDDVYQAADIVSADPRYAVYLGDGFIEIYRMADLPADTEFETDAYRLEA